MLYSCFMNALRRGIIASRQARSFRGKWACVIGLVCASTLSGCAFLPSTGYRNPAQVEGHNAIPKNVPLSRFGNSPYTVNGHTYYPLRSAAGYRQRGIASWYGRPFNGQKTSDGEIYNMYAMTAASKVLPLPSFALVRNLNNNRTAIVRINDRGPFYPGRIIDLSYAAAVRLGVLATGTAPVEVIGLRPGHGPRQAPSRSRSVVTAHRGPDVFGPHGSSFSTAKASARFFVQFGAFGRHQDADGYANRLEKKGLAHLHVFHAIVNGRKLYMVRLGPFADLHAAQVVSARVAHEGLGPTLIVDP